MKLSNFLFLCSFIFLFSCQDDECAHHDTCGKIDLETLPIINNCTPTATTSNEIFKVVEEMPSFPGCENITNREERQACSNQKMLEFIEANLNYPEAAIERNAEGLVVVRFAVDTIGCLSYIEVVRDDVGCGCGIEAQRIVSEMPNWNPGRQRGNAVRVQFNLPVVFEL